MARGRSKNKPNASGRNNFVRFSQWDHRLLESAAYRSLSPNSRALLVELTMLSNGANNGRISLSRADATARIGLVDAKATGAAFDELIAVGLIVMAKDAHFRIKADDRRAREWRLTWLPVPNRAGPTNDFQQWQPDASTPAGKRAAKRADRGLRVLAGLRKQRVQKQNTGEDSTPMTAIQPRIGMKPGEDSTPAKCRNQAFPPTRFGEESTPHIDTMGVGERGRVELGWWANDRWASTLATTWLIASFRNQLSGG